MAEPYGNRPPITATEATLFLAFDPEDETVPHLVDPKAAETGQQIASALEAIEWVAPEAPSLVTMLGNANAAIAAVRGVSAPTATDFAGHTGNLAAQATALNSIKAALKAAIEGKGVTVGAAALADYPSLIEQITGGGDGGEPAGTYAVADYVVAGYVE